MDDFRDHLLRDVLGEDSDPGFREELLGKTLRAARRKRHFKRLRQAAPAVVAIVGVMLICSRFFRTSPAPRASQNPTRPYTLVTSHPLATAATVATRPFAAQNLVDTVPSRHILETYAAHFAPREISDDDLLKLTGTSPVILVRHGPNSAELVFARPEDREAFFRN